MVDPPAAVSGEIGKIDSTDDSITISWEEVTEDHGSPIIGYVIEKRKKGSAVWVKCNEPEDCKRTEFKVSWNLISDLNFRLESVSRQQSFKKELNMSFE